MEVNDQRPVVEWTFDDGSVEEMRLSIDMYAENSNLYVALESLDGTEVVPLTVNTSITMGYPYVTADVGGAGEKVVAWLEERGLARFVGQKVHGQWQSWPIMAFNPEKLRGIDPEVFSAYRQAHGFLPEKNLGDLAKEAKGRAAEKNAQRPQKGKGRDPDLGR